MGKWTMGYTDDVLSYKLRDMIYASIERQKQHDGGQETHRISYDAVVQDLDQGDMFCSKLVDLLVYELADRRQRERVRPADLHSISDRTAHELRNLSHSRVYKRNNLRSIRPQSGFSSLHSRDQGVLFAEFTDDEDDNAMLGEAEGARINTAEYYDQYTNSVPFPLGSHSNASRVFPGRSPSLEESNSDDGVGFLGARYHARANAATEHSLHSLATDLSRRPSIRRRDYAARRRSQRGSTYDDSLDALHPESGPGPDASGSRVSGFDRAATTLPSPAFLSRRTMRRASENTSDPHTSSSRIRPFDITTSLAMPRLRRGGVQPPEMFADDRVHIPGLDEIAGRSPTMQWMRDDWGGPSTDPLNSLPTPRSSSPDESGTGPANI